MFEEAREGLFLVLGHDSVTMHFEGASVALILSPIGTLLRLSNSSVEVSSRTLFFFQPPFG